MSRRGPQCYFSPHLEVVAAVPVTAVLAQPQLLTGERLELRIPVMDNDDISDKFMTEGFSDPDMGYIVKIKYSNDRPKFDANLLKTDNWKQTVINCNFTADPPCPSLGNDVHSVNLLVFDGAMEDTDCVRATLKKTALVLKSVGDIHNVYSLKQSLSSSFGSETTLEDIESVVTGLKKFRFEETHLVKLRQYIRKVQNKVLELIEDNKSDYPTLSEHSVEDVLIAVQEEILKNVDNIATEMGEVTKGDVEAIKETFEAAKEAEKTVDNSENWQEIRFLRYLAEHSEKEEQDKIAQSKLLKPSEEDYVVLEAKELIKHFDQNGLSSKELEPAEVKHKTCPLRPQKTRDEYENIINQNFAPIPDADFSLKGLRFKEDTDFSKIEFTQFHDVYYNTGTKAENYDTECKNFRDCMVGPHRETKSTFSCGDSASTRMKVELSTNLRVGFHNIWRFFIFIY